MSEIESIPRELSVSDIDDTNRAFVREKITEIIDNQFKPLDDSISIKEIYVFGSFKDGTARKMVSDLDVRVVLHGDINESEGKLIRETIKNEVTKQLPSDRVFGYIDPKIFPAGYETNTDGEVL